MYFSRNVVGVIMMISVSCVTTQDNSATSMPTDDYIVTEENVEPIEPTRAETVMPTKTSVSTKIVAPTVQVPTRAPASTRIEAPTEASEPADVTITKVVCPPLPQNMDSLTQDQFTSELTRKCLYDKLSKPHTEEPLRVSMQVDLSHIESADQLQFKAHMLVQYLYNDNRLKFDRISPKRGNILGQQLLREKIWVPHITIRNDKDTSVSGIDAKDVFVSISPQGEVVYSYRMTATFYCWMNLHKFPFDSQECDLRWYSWAYNSSHLVLRWEGNHPVKIASNLYLTEFVLDGAWTSETETPASFTKGAFVGNFSELVFKFKLAREVGYYIMDYYLPSILLVCISWVSFWLQADASPPRVTLGTATMLSFITLNGALTKSLPKVSYITASEIWFLACACFIFCSMAEFAFVNVIWRRKKEVELKKQSSKHILKGALTPSLARKQLRKEESAGSLYRPRSCSSLDDNTSEAKANTESNYLTVHSFPSNLKIPTIKTESQDDLIESDASVTSIPIPGNNKQEPPTWHTMTPHEVAIWIDNKSRVVFPVTFLIFNIFYWSFVYVL